MASFPALAANDLVKLALAVAIIEDRPQGVDVRVFTMQMAMKGFSGTIQHQESELTKARSILTKFAPSSETKPKTVGFF